jgi:N-acetylmuramoyl-L-alanine amidase
MNIMLKTFVVACAATMALNNQSTAKAITADAIQYKTNIPAIDIGAIKLQEDHPLNDAVQVIGDMFHPQQEVQIETAQPVIKAVVNAVEVLANSPEQETKDANEPTDTTVRPVESAELVTEPVVTEPAVTEAPVAQETEPVDQQIEPVETAVQAEVEEATAPEEAPAEPTVAISQQEKDLFARLVEAEAKGEPYEGKVAVATVVLNRVESPEFPDSVTEVIKEKTGKAYAFSPVQNGEINKPASEESKQAVEEALKRENTLNDSIYFYNPEIATDNWIRSRQAVETIGNHVFAK